MRYARRRESRWLAPEEREQPQRVKAITGEAVRGDRNGSRQGSGDIRSRF